MIRKLADHEDVGGPHGLSGVGDHVLDGNVPRRLADAVDDVLAHPAGLLDRMGGEDHVGRLRVEHAEGVADRVSRVVLDDEPVRGDACLAQRPQRAVQPPPGGRPASVLVDHVAGPRRVHRREHGDELDVLLGRPPFHGVDQRMSRDGFVRDNQDVASHKRPPRVGSSRPLISDGRTGKARTA
jgi:hypothetical protein